MPFTPAHVVAVLPGLGERRPRWVVPAALVIGSMVPDLLYFVPVGDHRADSHSVLGVLTLDLALGLASLAAWWYVAAPVVDDLVPGRLRGRLPRPTRPGPREWLLAVPCLVLGALTHVAWDGFTHAGGWAVVRWPWLGSEVAGLPLYQLGQYLSGLLGVLVLLLWGARHLAAPREHPPARATADERRLARLVLVVAPLVAGAAFGAAALRVGERPEYLAYVLVVRGISAFGLAATVVALWWHAAPGRRAPAH